MTLSYKPVQRTSQHIRRSMFLERHAVCSHTVVKARTAPRHLAYNSEPWSWLTLISQSWDTISSRFQFNDALNISGHERRFLQWVWKVRQILLRGSNFGLRFFYVPQICNTGPTTLLSFLRKLYSGFLLSEKNPSTSAGFKPVNLGSSGEYDNHGTTGVDVRHC